MNKWLVGFSIAVLALYTFFVFPGHTYLTQDTQIYVPILENLWDGTVLTQDLLVSRSHVAFTLYDEYAVAMRWLTHLNFGFVLQGTQLLCRALGMFGVYLIALPILKNRLTSLAVSAVCGMGAEVWGPAVLVVEYEPSPRAFSIPLVFLTVGLLVNRRFWWAGLVAAVALMIHPTSAVPLWLCFALLKQWKIGFVSLVVGVAALAISAAFEPGMHEGNIVTGRVSPPLESIQRMRSLYNWVGMWIGSEWPKYAACLAAGGLALWRLWPYTPPELRLLLIGLPALGLATLPVSYLFLDRLKWSFVPQIQPARQMLFCVAIPILLTATAAFRVRRRWEAPLWLTLALTPAVAAPRPRMIWTPAVQNLSRWAATNTAKDAVFLFPRAGKSLEPGLFRSQSLRAVYVDWKGGGQANFLPELGLEWWKRYQDVMKQPQTLEHYRSLGIDYVIFPGDPYRIVKVSNR